MYFPRKLSRSITKHLLTREIIVVTGMRRVGKTTLLRQIFSEIKSKNKLFLDIENPLEQKIFEEVDYNNILANLEKYNVYPKKKIYLFLDEVQAQPDIIKAIKYLYDHFDIKFFITGSSSFYLKNLFTESLAGRKIIFELYPLDFEEFLIFKKYLKRFFIKFEDKERHKNLIAYEKEKKLYEEYLEFGGFPQVVLAKTQTAKKEWLNDIFKSYFEKDVQRLADFKEINSFRDLMLLLLERVGSKLDISKLSSEVGVSRETIYSYLSFLQATYFIYLLTPYTKNVDREISGAKKIYLCDNGIVNLFSRIESGALLENAIFHNIKKYGKIQYYERRSGGEVDFILNEKIALEVKRTGTISDYKKIQAIARRLNLKNYYIITKKFAPQQGFIPASDI